MSRPHRARKRFGQHFLTDSGTRDRIVDAIAPSADDTVVEIGPGLGALTVPLMATGTRLHAIEFDRDLAARLRERFGSEPRFTLHEADALGFDVTDLGCDLRVAGNLPYNISTPLLFHLLDALDAIRDMHFMLQKEVVERLAAEPGSKRYGRLTVMLGCRARAEALFDVPPEAFDPPPKVLSSVVRIEPMSDDRPQINDPAQLSRLVASAFSQRRKTLRNALRNSVDAVTLEAAGIDPGARAETIPVNAWIRLANLTAETHPAGEG